MVMFFELKTKNNFLKQDNSNQTEKLLEVHVIS